MIDLEAKLSGIRCLILEMKTPNVLRRNMRYYLDWKTIRDVKKLTEYSKKLEEYVKRMEAFIDKIKSYNTITNTNTIPKLDVHVHCMDHRLNLIVIFL